MKYAMIAALLAGGLAAELTSTEPAQARHYCPRGGYCLSGTSLKFNPSARVQYACNVTVSRSAANCGR